MPAATPRVGVGALGLALVVSLATGRSFAQPSAGGVEPAPVASGAPSDKVRVTYAAPPGCPDEGAFMDLLRARLGTGWEASPLEPASTADVHVTVDGGASVARLATVDRVSGPSLRMVTGSTCAEVVAGIALVTALAIDARVGPRAAEGPSPGPAPPPPPPAPVEAPPPGPDSPPAAPRPAGVAGSSLVWPLHFDLGGAAVVAGGVGPELAWGPRIFAGVGAPGGPDVSVAVESITTGLAPHNARFTLTAVGLSGCPLGLELGEGLRALPCAGVLAGALRGEGTGDDDYRGASASAGYLVVVPSLRLEGTFGPLLIAVGADARIPLEERTFIITDEPRDRVVYQVPWVAASASLGVGVRL